MSEIFRTYGLQKSQKKFFPLMIVCRILGKDIHTGGFLRQRKVGFGKNRQDLSEKNSKKNIEKTLQIIYQCGII
ncbi:MAG: hypothetical protein ACLTWW_03310 [Negativibacillus sp.]